MKRILLTVLTTLLVMTAGAQLSPYRQFSVFDGNHYWFEAGATYSKNSAKTSDYKVGYRAGVGADIPIFYSSVSFLPSLMFECKGFTDEKIDNKEPYLTDVTSMYIEMPIDFSVNLPIGKRFGLQFCAGPYVAVGIAGSCTESSENNVGQYGTRTIEPEVFEKSTVGLGDLAVERENPLLRRFDVGADLGVRFIFLRYVMVKVNAELGFINMNGDETAPAFRNRSFSASVAFRL